MKALFIGCTDLSYALLEKLLKLNDIDVCGVVTRETLSTNSVFCSLEPLAKEKRIPCLNIKINQQEEMAAWIKKREPHIIFCISWPHLLNSKILTAAKYGAIGYHPAILPRNRGDDLIAWALALGLTKTGSTFFVMKESAASGDIVSQQLISICDEDNAATLYTKLTNAARDQFEELVIALFSGRLKRKPQDSVKAITWRKRCKKDGQIDWRMSSESIFNLVRALTHPYLGAYCVIGDQEYKVWKAANIEVVKQDIEPGRVLSAGPDGITINCGKGAIKLTEHEIKNLPSEGDYL